MTANQTLFVLSAKTKEQHTVYDQLLYMRLTGPRRRSNQLGIETNYAKQCLTLAPRLIAEHVGGHSGLAWNLPLLLPSLDWVFGGSNLQVPRARWQFDERCGTNSKALQ